MSLRSISLPEVKLHFVALGATVEKGVPEVGVGALEVALSTRVPVEEARVLLFVIIGGLRKEDLVSDVLGETDFFSDVFDVYCIILNSC